MFLEFLRQDFNDRQSRNSRFSLRAYARLLDENPSYLSKILSEKRGLTAKKIIRYGEKLGLGEDEIQKHVLLNEKTRRAAQTPKRKLAQRLTNKGPENKVTSWRHFMLPALVKVKGGSVDLEWLMNKLKVSTDIGSELISDLVSSGLVKFNEMTGMVSNETSYAFKKFGSHDKASRDVFISSYKKSLEIAKDSIEELEQAQDEAKEAELLKQMAHGFCFISAHEENIEEARQRIGEFRRNLIRLLESSEDPQKKPDCLVNLCTGFNVMDIS